MTATSKPSKKKPKSESTVEAATEKVSSISNTQSTLARTSEQTRQEKDVTTEIAKNTKETDKTKQKEGESTTNPTKSTAKESESSSKSPQNTSPHDVTPTSSSDPSDVVHTSSSGHETQFQTSSSSKSQLKNETQTNETLQPLLKNDADSKDSSPPTENFVVPKLVRPKETEYNQPLNDEDEFDFANKHNISRTENRHRNPHVHNHRPAKHGVRDNKDLDVETEFEISHQNPNNLSSKIAAEVINTSRLKNDVNGSQFDGLPRAQGFHSHNRASLRRRNTGTGSASSFHISHWALALYTSLMFLVYHLLDFSILPYLS